MSVNGLFAGSIQDNDGGLTSTFSTNSVYVSYSDTMDNGMGVSVAMSLTAADLLLTLTLTLAWEQLALEQVKTQLLTQWTDLQLVSHLTLAALH